MKAGVVILIVVLGITSSTALKCYSCVWPAEGKCQDPSMLKDLSPSECSEPSSVEKNLGVKSVCLKNVIDVNGIKQITRSCTKQGGAYSVCSALASSVEHCSVCEGDLCNGSTNFRFNLLALLIPAAIVIFMKLF